MLCVARASSQELLRFGLVCILDVVVRWKKQAIQHAALRDFSLRGTPAQTNHFCRTLETRALRASHPARALHADGCTLVGQPACAVDANMFLEHTRASQAYRPPAPPPQTACASIAPPQPKSCRRPPCSRRGKRSPSCGRGRSRNLGAADTWKYSRYQKVASLSCLSLPLPLPHIYCVSVFPPPPFWRRVHGSSHHSDSNFRVQLVRPRGMPQTYKRVVVVVRIAEIVAAATAGGGAQLLSL